MIRAAPQALSLEAVAGPVGSGSDDSGAFPSSDRSSRQCWEQDPLVTFQVRNTFLELCNVDTGPDDDSEAAGSPRGRPRRRGHRARAGSEPPSATATPSERRFPYRRCDGRARRTNGGLLGDDAVRTPSPSRGLELGHTLRSLRHEADVAEMAAEEALRRRDACLARAAACCPGGTATVNAQLRAEERELLEKLYAVEQDLADTQVAQRVAERRGEEVREGLHRELEAQAHELAGLQEECAALEREVQAESRQCVAEAQRLEELTEIRAAASLPRASGLGADADGVGSRGAAVGAQPGAHAAKAEAMLQLASARHAAASAAQRRDEAQREPRALEAQPPEADAAEEREVEAARQAAAAAAARRKDALARQATWRKLLETQLEQAEAAERRARKAEERAAEGEARVATLQKHLEAMAPGLEAARAAREAARGDLEGARRRHSMSLALFALALGLAAARALALLAA